MKQALVIGDSWAIPYLGRLPERDEMKQALVIGDSWAITLTHSFHNKLYPPHDYGPNHVGHIEFKLRQAGYAVNNRSWGGSTNHLQLTQAEYYLDWQDYIGQPLDLIVWFHTELLRDWNRTDQKELSKMAFLGLDRYLDKKAIEIYSMAANAMKRFPKTKWIIIGGHCPIRPAFRNILEDAVLIVDNWRQELAGVECPECHTLTFIDEFERFVKMFPTHIIERELNNREIIMDACQDTNVFYDKVHPSPKSMSLLGDRIVRFLQDNNF